MRGPSDPAASDAQATPGWGTFLLAIDLELAWGWTIDAAFNRHRDRIVRGRRALSDLLEILDEYEVPATWAVVGHLFLESCKRVDGVIHPEITRPRYPWSTEDWYASDPGSDVDADPLWYAPDLINEIVSRDVGHEIGSHSFGHVLFGEEGCSEEAARSDLRAAVRVAGTQGLSPRAFVFPRHSVGFTELLSPFGFVAYRGTSSEPGLGLHPLVRRPLRFVIRSLGIAPAPQVPRMVGDGVVDLPASMLFSLPEGRVGALISPSSLARRSKAGIRRAIKEGSMFQIYFHDHNLGVRTGAFLGALRSVLRLVAAERQAGRLRVATMERYAELCHTERPR